MALTIQGATIGYNANEVQTAINNLNTKVVRETINTMNRKLSDLRRVVDSAWVGQSAEQFKKNMQADVSRISKGLEDAAEILQQELREIINKMDEMDQGLVQKRGEK